MIRPLAPGETAGVAELEQVLFPDDPWSRATLDGLLATPGRRAWAGTRDGRVVAYLLTGLSGDFVDLLRVGVLPAARRTGLAAGLLAEAVRAAAADGADRMLLEVGEGNEAARRLYEGAGFEVVDVRRRYYRDGSDALVMQRDLTRSRSAGEEPSGRMGA